MTLPLRAFVIALGVLWSSTAFAQPPAEQSPEERDEAARTKVCRDDIARYSLNFAGDTSGRFQAKEVMKWVNPVRDRQLGVVSLWLKDGRPQAMSTVFTTHLEAGLINVAHEFKSLATRPIVATFDNDVKWAPAQAGVTFKPFPEAPEPAETPVARLRQMRGLTRDFSAHSVSIHGTETRWELRMLTQPLYRYETPGREVLDGAVFTFVSNAGTDPELIVLIEARRSGDRWAWHYAAARFSDHSLYLRLRDSEVWTFRNEERNSHFEAGMNDTYRLFRDRQLPAKFELGKETP